MRFVPRLVFVGALTAAMGILAGNASAADHFWRDGTLNHDWADPTNWDPMGVPDASSDIRVQGLIKTDFGGRSLDFTNDESLTEYQELVGKLMTGFGSLSGNASEPELVADVIYQAAIDGSNRLRYTAGPDAKEIIANRKAAVDETFIGGIKVQFEL